MLGFRNSAESVGPAADPSVPDTGSQPQVFRRRLVVALSAMLTAVLLSLSFAPFDCWYLAYVALAPWAFALICGERRRSAILCGWLAGLVFWGANVYWLCWITPIGYAAAVAYLSVYWLVAAIILRAASRRNWPIWLVLPVIWVALEYARVYVISGFPWFFLAHSQYQQARIIQISDVTGQYGVSFFVAMVNGAIVDLLVCFLFRRRGSRPNRRIVTATCAAVLSAAGLCLYGTYRLNQDTLSPGPTVGIVQGAYPNDLRATERVSEVTILQDHLDAGERFVGKGCHMLLFAETMLPKGLNPGLLELDIDKLDPLDLRSLAGQFCSPVALSDVSDEDLRVNLKWWIRGERPGGSEDATHSLQYHADQVGSLSRRLGCPILAGGATVHRNLLPLHPGDRWVVRNSALWFDGSPISSAIYSKVHLVPFGEYVPFKHSWPGLHRALRSFVPAVMEQLDPGERFVHFTLKRDGKTWNIAAPICYEGVFARVCRKMVMKDGKKPKNMVLANISNDGWFVWHWWQGRYRGSTEQAQHLAQYCFRAVENRVPVVRAVNTGISASFDPNGRIVKVLEQNVAGRKRRTMISGTILAEVLVDSRTSLYSIAGDVFAAVVALAGLAIAFVLVWKRNTTTKGVEN